MPGRMSMSAQLLMGAVSAARRGIAMGRSPDRLSVTVSAVTALRIAVA